MSLSPKSPHARIQSYSSSDNDNDSENPRDNNSITQVDTVAPAAANYSDEEDVEEETTPSTPQNDTHRYIDTSTVPQQQMDSPSRNMANDSSGDDPDGSTRKRRKKSRSSKRSASRSSRRTSRRKRNRPAVMDEDDEDEEETPQSDPDLQQDDSDQQSIETSRRHSRVENTTKRRKSRKNLHKKKSRDRNSRERSKAVGLTYEMVDTEDFLGNTNNNPQQQQEPSSAVSSQRSETNQRASLEKQTTNATLSGPKTLLQNINVVSKMHGDTGKDGNSYFVYVEDGINGRFKKMQYSQLLKQHLEQEKQKQQQPPDELSSRNSRRQLRMRYQQLYYHLAAVVLNTFSFCRGLLAGVCLMHLALTYFSNFNSFVVHFLQWYSPVCSLLLKLYMILVQISLVGSAFELLFRSSSHGADESAAPSSIARISVPQRVALILQFLVFLFVFYCTLCISSLDDFFQYQQWKNAQWFNDSAFIDSYEFNSRFIPWHVLNALRSIAILAAYVVSFLFNREQGRNLQALLAPKPIHPTQRHAIHPGM